MTRSMGANHVPTSILSLKIIHVRSKSQLNVRYWTFNCKCLSIIM